MKQYFDPVFDLTALWYRVDYNGKAYFIYVIKSEDQNLDSNCIYTYTELLKCMIEYPLSNSVKLYDYSNISFITELGIYINKHQFKVEPILTEIK